MNKIHAARIVAPLALIAGLTACGGGDDDTTAAAPAGASTSGTLTISAAQPAAHNGDINAATAASPTTEARAADAAIASPYCAITLPAALSSNGKKYDVKVYFLQADAKPVNLSIGQSPTFDWGLSDFQAAGIAGVTVDVAQKTVAITHKAMANHIDPALTGTVNGSFKFPASTTAACGT